MGAHDDTNTTDAETGSVDPVAQLLAGVRVIDFTQALSGPYATLMLADLGADVIKIEAPNGDDARHWGPPFQGDDASYFLSVNRNKRSVVLDLKKPDDLHAARKIIDTADIVVENWRTGTAERLGIGYETVRDTNPGLIYCSIIGFGPDDTLRAGYDQIVQGTAGVMTMTGPPDRPTKWGIPVADIAAGMFAATAVVAALNSRKTSGKGCRIQTSMEDSMVAMLTHHATRYLATGVPPISADNGHGTIAPYGMFAAKDGNVNICVGNNSQFLRMCEGLDLATLATDPRYSSNPGRNEHKEDLLKSIEAKTATMTVDNVVATLEPLGVPVGPVRTLDQVLADPAIRARGMVSTMTREDFGTAEAPNGPWRIDGHVAQMRRHPPLLGEHTGEVLAELEVAEPTPEPRRHPASAGA